MRAIASVSISNTTHRTPSKFLTDFRYAMLIRLCGDLWHQFVRQRPCHHVNGKSVMGLMMLAAACGATLYAFHCFDDSPLFVATWYSLAAIPVVAVGALAGYRFLRW